MRERPVHDLPERLALPLETGEPWWYWLGGRPALDLVNTLRERWRRRVETLVTPADLERWLVEAGVMAAETDVAATPEVLAEARALREAIDACVTALLEGAPSPPAAVKRIDGWLKFARRPAALVLDAHVRQRSQGASPPREGAERHVTSRYRWVILGVGAAGAGAFSALRMGLPSLGPALRSAYGLSLPQVGLAFTAVAIGVMLTLVPWGALTDRIGDRPVMGAGLAGTALALAATAYASGYAMLLAGLLVAGMFGSSSTGASGRAVMGWFGRSERGLALGIRQMALPLGGAAASVALPQLAGASGLRGAFLTLAGLSLVAAVAAVAFMRDAPPPDRPLPTIPAPPPTRDPRLWRPPAPPA